MHYFGKDADTSHNVIYCNKCARRMEIQKLLQPIPFHDVPQEAISDLRDMAITYVEDRVYGNSVKDVDHYMFEEAIKTFYGPDIWPKLNQLPDEE